MTAIAVSSQCICCLAVTLCLSEPLTNSNITLVNMYPHMFCSYIQELNSYFSLKDKKTVLSQVCLIFSSHSEDKGCWMLMSVTKGNFSFYSNELRFFKENKASLIDFPRRRFIRCQLLTKLLYCPPPPPGWNSRFMFIAKLPPAN